MKRLVFSSLFSVIALTASAQTADVKTDTIAVSGNCSMCKKRIEDAAYSKGVKRADWNDETKKLVVVYRPSKTNLTAIQQHIAAAGHDAGPVAAKEADYKKLPDCCQYKSNSCNH
ncbi:MAG: hypothetical protein EOP52_09870 [Sphingobacteriales bacterium]|nr:MAG: hypothetical protein EOP52_09870 [Sphingobacteriales bacterium]